MSLVISQSIAILPWIFGIFFLYLIMPKYFRAGYGFSFLMIGTAFLVGNLGLAAQIWLLDQLNVKSISLFLIATNSIIFFILLILRCFSRESSSEQIKIVTVSYYNPVFILAISLSLVVAVFVIHENFLLPAVAWDTVWYWAHEANEFLIHENLIEKVSPFLNSGNHPRTLTYVMAWGGWSASIGDPIRLAPLIPWLHLYFAIAISIFGLFLRATKSLIISAVFTYIFLSTPLVEIHAAQGGYADLWLAFPMFISILFFCEYQKVKEIELLLLALAIALMPIFIKGVGNIYSISMYAIFVITLAANKWNHPIIFAFFGVLILAISSLDKVNFDLTVFGERFSILSKEGWVMLGGKQMYFSTNEWSAVLYNLYIALFVKNSFGILFWIVALSYSYLLSLIIVKRKNEVFPSLGLFTLITCVLIAALRYTDYFFTFSHPGNDTSLSRACMVLFLLGFSIIASAIGELSKAEKLMN